MGVGRRASNATGAHISRGQEECGVATSDDASIVSRAEDERRAGDSPSAAITRATALRVALSLIDREGAGSLSLRRLSVELGVVPSVVHYHTGGKDELLDSVVDAVLAEIALPPLVTGSSWLDRVRDVACAYRSALLRHPKALPIVVSRPSRARSLRVTETLLAVMRRGGLGPTGAWNIATALTAYVLGYVLLEVGNTPAEVNGIPAGGLAARLQDAQPHEYPLVAAVAAGMETEGIDNDLAFAAGLDAFLAGLARAESETSR